MAIGKQSAKLISVIAIFCKFIVLQMFNLNFPL